MKFVAIIVIVAALAYGGYQLVPDVQRTADSWMGKGSEASDVEYWSDVGYQVVEGVPYWTVNAGYGVNTFFGLGMDERTALVREGKVVKWIDPEPEE